MKDWDRDGMWIVSLSNGATVKEIDLYEPNEDSPWNKLMKYIEVKNGEVFITSLRYVMKGTTYVIPSKSKKMFKHSTRGVPMKPKGFNYFIGTWSESNQYFQLVDKGSAKRLEAYYDDFKIVMYVDASASTVWVTVEEYEDGSSPKFF